MSRTIQDENRTQATSRRSGGDMGEPQHTTPPAVAGMWAVRIDRRRGDRLTRRIAGAIAGRTNGGADAAR